MKSVLVISQSSANKSFVDFTHSKFSDAILTKVDCSEEPQFVSELNNLKPKSFDEAYVFVVPDEDTMASLLDVLKPNGKLMIETCIPTREEGQALCSDLQLQGFVDTMIAKDPVSGDRFLTCSKPSWEMGESATINISQKNSATTAWKMDTDDLAETDLVDEDELLDDNLEITVGAGCGIDPATGKRIGKKKACRNCSCGLKELEEEEKRQEQTVPYNSACGSCYKGDAFRCASCPFLGKPAFEPTDENKRVMLAMGSDDI